VLERLNLRESLMHVCEGLLDCRLVSFFRRFSDLAAIARARGASVARRRSVTQGLPASFAAGTSPRRAIQRRAVAVALAHHERAAVVPGPTRCQVQRDVRAFIAKGRPRDETGDDR
jgi:hypothetical protein